MQEKSPKKTRISSKSLVFLCLSSNLQKMTAGILLMGYIKSGNMIGKPIRKCLYEGKKDERWGGLEEGGVTPLGVSLEVYVLSSCFDLGYQGSERPAVLVLIRRKNQRHRGGM